SGRQPSNRHTGGAPRGAELRSVQDVSKRRRGSARRVRRQGRPPHPVPRGALRASEKADPSRRLTREPRFAPSRAMPFRIGFAAAFLLTVQGVIECLTWRTPGLPFGLNYEPATHQLFIHDFAQAFEMARAVVSGAIDEPYAVRGQLAFMELAAGRRMDVVMPYVYSPTSWLIL